MGISFGDKASVKKREISITLFINTSQRIYRNYASSKQACPGPNPGVVQSRTLNGEVKRLNTFYARAISDGNRTEIAYLIKVVLIRKPTGILHIAGNHVYEDLNSEIFNSVGTCPRIP